MPEIRHRLRALANRARARLARRSVPDLALPERARPVPEGWTEERLRTALSTLRVDDAPKEEMAGYVAEAFWRFLHTWGLVREESGRALELGANPYFLTWLLEEHSDLDLTLANYFGDERQEIVQTVTLSPGDGREVTWDVRSSLFNMEASTFPYDDDSFDVVLFCEIIEHLLTDPLHALAEIHRVLKPDGVLVVTTPNVARLANVLALVEGGNVYDPYSGYGAYGRHNREYTNHELVHLLRFAGYTVDEAFTADAHPEANGVRPAYAAVGPALRGRSEDLGQYLFVRARATHAAGDGLPAFLYRSVAADVPLVDVFDPAQPWNGTGDGGAA